MNCPFLKEARVRYCDKSALRKMIRIAGDVAQERCSSERYKQCSVYQRFPEESGSAHCPYLCESLAQYCAGSSVSRFILYSDPLLSRCYSDAHRYCDVYLGSAAPDAQAGEGNPDCSVGGMRFPDCLRYTSNHMWLDTAQGGSCHVGLDAFLARVLGAVERITFMKQTGIHRPSAVLTVHGVDLEVVFPNAMLLTASNLYLRANPAKLTADPYGMGWLFQGIQSPAQPPVTSDLIRADAMPAWIEGEIGRMSNFLADCWAGRHETQVMNDGGVFTADVLEHLNREDTLRLFHEFFWSLRERSALN